MIRSATVAELRARAGELILEAAAETASDSEVQWQWLEDLEAVNGLLCLAVDVAGELEGYLVAAVGPEVWNTSTSCTTLSLFVRRPHRWRWGWALVRELLERTAARKVSIVRLGVLPCSRLHRLAHRIGFAETAITMEIAPQAWKVQYSARDGGAGDPAPGSGLRHLRRGDAGCGRAEGAAAGAGGSAES